MAAVAPYYASAPPAYGPGCPGMYAPPGTSAQPPHLHELKQLFLGLEPEEARRGRVANLLQRLGPQEAMSTVPFVLDRMANFPSSSISFGALVLGELLRLHPAVLAQGFQPERVYDLFSQDVDDSPSAAFLYNLLRFKEAQGMSVQIEVSKLQKLLARRSAVEPHLQALQRAPASPLRSWLCRIWLDIPTSRSDEKLVVECCARWVGDGLWGPMEKAPCFQMLQAEVDRRGNPEGQAWLMAHFLAQVCRSPESIDYQQMLFLLPELPSPFLLQPLLQDLASDPQRLLTLWLCLSTWPPMVPMPQAPRLVLPPGSPTPLHALLTSVLLVYSQLPGASELCRSCLLSTAAVAAGSTGRLSAAAADLLLLLHKNGPALAADVWMSVRPAVERVANTYPAAYELMQRLHSGMPSGQTAAQPAMGATQPALGACPPMQAALPAYNPAGSGMCGTGPPGSLATMSGAPGAAPGTYAAAPPNGSCGGPPPPTASYGGAPSPSSYQTNCGCPPSACNPFNASQGSCCNGCGGGYGGGTGGCDGYGGYATAPPAPSTGGYAHPGYGLQGGESPAPLRMPSKTMQVAKQPMAMGDGAPARFEHPRVGLQNSNNTCYMNTVIQSLFLTSTFVQALFNFQLRLKKNASKVDKEDFDFGLKLVELLKKQVAKMLLTKQPHVDILEILDNFPESYRSGQQQDVTEALGYVFDKLGGHEQGLVGDVFGGRLAEKTQCLVCQSVKDRPETFTELVLKVPTEEQVRQVGGLPTTQNLLDMRLQYEYMSESDKVWCDYCRCAQQAGRWSEIIVPPAHLIIHLNRFSFDAEQGTPTKEKTSVKVDGQLRVGHSFYLLYMVIVHTGKDAMSGHYYAIGSRSEPPGGRRQWCLMDDSQLKPPDLALLAGFSEKKDDSPYVLFYRRRDASPTTPVFVPRKYAELVWQEDARQMN